MIRKKLARWLLKTIRMSPSDVVEADDMLALASSAEYEEFLQSNVWKDLSNLLRFLRERAREGNDNEKDVDEIRKRQGMIFALDTVLYLPVERRGELVVIEELEAGKKKKEEKNHGG